MCGKENDGTADGNSAIQSADTPPAVAAASDAPQDTQPTRGSLQSWIGLLDGQGRLVWMNRGHGSAQLNPLPTLPYRDLHAWLHPACMLLQCPLAAALAECWAVVLRESYCEEQVRDIVMDRVLHVSAWRVPSLGVSTPPDGDPHAVIAVLTDAAPMRVAKEMRRTGSREIELRMLRHSDALAHANRDLHDELVHCQIEKEEMRVSHAEIEDAARRLLSAQELERVWIARQLRESVIQTLGAVKYQLETRDGQAKSAITQLQNAMGDVDAIATSVRPSLLDDFGAVSAVRWLCREFAKSHPMLEVRETLAVRDEAVPEQLKAPVFRSAQELLSIVAICSQATHVSVCLSQASGQLVLEVLDDGAGSRSACCERSAASKQPLFLVRMHAEWNGGQFSSSAVEGGKGTRTRLQWLLTGGTNETRSHL